MTSRRAPICFPTPPIALSGLELADVFRQAHIFVLPFLYEGLSLVLLEALACGCRLVVTDLPGVREVLGGVAAEWVERVDLPRLENVDLPVAADEANFEHKLQRALYAQIKRAAKNPEAQRKSS